LKRDRHFRVDKNTDLDNFLIKHDQDFQAWILDILEKYRTGIISESVEITKDKELNRELKRLKNLKLQLDIFNDLKNLNYDWQQTRRIIKGSLDISDDPLKFVASKGDPNVCDYCKHFHASTEPKVCTELSCNCGLR